MSSPSVSTDQDSHRPARRLTDFYPHWFQRSFVIGFALHLTILPIGLGAFLILNPIDTILAVCVVIGIAVLGEIGILTLMLKLVFEPLNILTRALIYVDGESTDSTPPNLNNPTYSKTGLKQFLDVVYQFRDQPSPVTSSKKNDMATQVLSALPVGFIALDSAGHIIARNRLAPMTKINGRDTIDLSFRDQGISLAEWLDTAHKDKIDDEYFWTHVRTATAKRDEQRIFDVLAHYNKSTASGIDTIIILTDRTGSYINEQNNMDFITLAAHELRGPITVLRGYLELLNDLTAKRLTSEERNLIDRLNVSAKRLADYVNNILNAAHYDQQHLSLSLRETPVDVLIDDIRDDMALRATTLNRNLVFTVPHNIPTVAADRNSISEVLSNLIDNAIKYSRKNGRIDVGVDMRGSDFVEFTVRDHGIGLAPDIAQHLFTKFYRSHRSRGVVGGSGLGLYISRAIIESHGGRISATSREGEGSTFMFTLPTWTVAQQRLGGKYNNADLIRDTDTQIINHGMVDG
jgi:signal transduction histidine kinase